MVESECGTLRGQLGEEGAAANHRKMDVKPLPHEPRDRGHQDVLPLAGMRAAHDADEDAAPAARTNRGDGFRIGRIGQRDRVRHQARVLRPGRDEFAARRVGAAQHEIGAGRDPPVDPLVEPVHAGMGRTEPAMDIAAKGSRGRLRAASQAVRFARMSLAWRSASPSAPAIRRRQRAAAMALCGPRHRIVIAGRPAAADSRAGSALAGSRSRTTGTGSTPRPRSAGMRRTRSVSGPP